MTTDLPQVWRRRTPMGAECLTCGWSDPQAKTARVARRHAIDQPGHHAVFMIEAATSYKRTEEPSDAA